MALKKVTPAQARALRYIKRRNTRGRPGTPVRDVFENFQARTVHALHKRGLISYRFRRGTPYYFVTKMGRRIVETLAA